MIQENHTSFLLKLVRFYLLIGTAYNLCEFSANTADYLLDFLFTGIVWMHVNNGIGLFHKMSPFVLYLLRGKEVIPTFCLLFYPLDLANGSQEILVNLSEVFPPHRCRRSAETDKGAALGKICQKPIDLYW